MSCRAAVAAEPAPRGLGWPQEGPAFVSDHCSLALCVLCPNETAEQASRERTLTQISFAESSQPPASRAQHPRQVLPAPTRAPSRHSCLWVLVTCLSGQHIDSCSSPQATAMRLGGGALRKVLTSSRRAALSGLQLSTPVPPAEDSWEPLPTGHPPT